MTNPNWGLLAQNQNQTMNALSQGFQIGQAIKGEREAKERQNALSAYVTNPEAEGAFAGLAQAAPEIAMRERGRMDQQQQQQRQADMQARAAQGDEEALAQLAGVDLNAWAKLDDRTRSQAEEQMKVLGNASLDILNRPPEQRPQVFDAYIAQLSSQFPSLAQYQGQYSEEMLRGVVAQAGAMEKLMASQRPRYQVLPEGATLVDTSNPQAVQDYSAQQAAGSSPTLPDGFVLDQGGPQASPADTF